MRLLAPFGFRVPVLVLPKPRPQEGGFGFEEGADGGILLSTQKAPERLKRLKDYQQSEQIARKQRAFMLQAACM